MRICVWALLAAAAGPVWTADVETQHAFDVTVPLRPNLEVLLHSRIRTQPGVLGFYQVRAGPIVSWRIRPRLALIGGYYYARQEQADNDFVGGHRPFAGGEVGLVEARRFSLDQRFLAERFLPGGGAHFNRYRLRTRIGAKGPIAPYASHEAFADARGWRSTRYSAGIRWKMLPAVQFDFGYFYEQRRASLAADRHMWITSIHLTRSSRRADPDL